MEVIKPREGFFQNIVNYTTIGNYIKEKLKGRESLFSFHCDDHNIRIYYEGKGNKDLMLSNLVEKLNKDFVGGLCLFICSDDSVCLNGSCTEMEVNEKEGIFDKLTWDGYAVLEAPYKHGSHITGKLLRPGRIDTDLRNLVSIVSKRYGFMDDEGSGIQGCFTLDYANNGFGFETGFVELMYSIKCSTPEIAEEFAKKWVSVLQEEGMYNKYSYLIETMIDPALLNPNYQGYNRVYGDPSVLIGFVYTDKSMYEGSWVTFDESQLPSKSDWWFQR